VIGLLRGCLEVTTSLLTPLLERDPEVYESRVVRRWAKRYVMYALLAKSADSSQQLRYAAKAAAARAALLHIPVAPHIVEELELTIHLHGD
jgi:hypothetical protein